MAEVTLSLPILLWVAVIAVNLVLVLLDRAPTRLRHGAPYTIVSLVFGVPLFIAFYAVALGLAWWVPALVILGLLVVSIVVASVRQE